VNAVSEVRRAIMQLTCSPADFDEVMFSLVTLLTDNLHDNSTVEAIVEDLFCQVCLWSHQSSGSVSYAANEGLCDVRRDTDNESRV